MPFDNEKRCFLGKLDKSRKGAIDRPVKELIGLINSSNDYYTTSSCSGRITLMTSPPPRKKYEAVWLYMTHGRPDKQKIRKSLKTVPDDQVWLKMESFILHLRASSLPAAEVILAAAKKAGFKHTGIISLRRKIIIEIFGADRLDVPIADKGSLLLADDYLGYLIDQADMKLQQNLSRILKFEKILKDSLETR
jgi:tRNA wybutosine-synthesizing protein 3